MTAIVMRDSIRPKLRGRWFTTKHCVPSSAFLSRFQGTGKVNGLLRQRLSLTDKDIVSHWCAGVNDFFMVLWLFFVTGVMWCFLVVVCDVLRLWEAL